MATEEKIKVPTPVKEKAPAKAKRTQLTAAERVAKLEADLDAARAKATEAATKQSDVLKEQRAKLVGQIADRQKKVNAIDAQLNELGTDVVADGTTEDTES